MYFRMVSVAETDLFGDLSESGGFYVCVCVCVRRGVIPPPPPVMVYGDSHQPIIHVNCFPSEREVLGVSVDLGLP